MDQFSISNFKDEAIKEYMRLTGQEKGSVTALWHGLHQFLRMVALTEERQVAPTPVDELWHTALKFTEDYRKFCLKAFGRMIHHMPATVPNKPSGYLITRKKAEEMYGALPPSIWPLEDRTDWSVGYLVEGE